MGDVVDIKSVPTKDDFELVVELARFAEGLTDAAAIKKKWRLGDDVWNALGEDDDFCRAVTDEVTRRVRSGATKRERAQLEVIDAPPILAKIMRSPESNSRHIIDSIKTLDALATGPGSEAAAASARFEIKIILNSDVLQFSKSIEPNCDDIDPFNTTEAITVDTNKSKDDDSDG